MYTKMIVLVADRDDPKHGEITVLDDTGKAARLVETLLEAGFEQDRIRVFNGSEMEMQVSHRPAVSLVGEGTDGDGGWEESPNGNKAPEAVKETVAEEEPEEKKKAATANAYMQGGIRFSSMFRSA